MEEFKNKASYMQQQKWSTVRNNMPFTLLKSRAFISKAHIILQYPTLLPAVCILQSLSNRVRLMCAVL